MICVAFGSISVPNMTIVDRYLLFQFFKIFLVCFVSMAGLYVVINIFTNLDEFVQISGADGGLNNLIVNFYGPRVLDVFCRLAGILVLVASVFSIAIMQRKREATATEAAGITKARLVRPLIFAAVFVIGLAAIGREFYLPQYKEMLVKSLTNWSQSGTVTMHQQKDLETGILFKGDKLIIDESTITDIQLTMPRKWSPEFIDVHAAKGVIHAADANTGTPAGVLLSGVTQPKRLLTSPSIHHGDKTIVFTPSDFSWLPSNAVFVACNLDVQEMAFGDNLFKYSSIDEMIESLKKPSRSVRLGDQVAIHNRILKPVLELTLVLIGLPLVISDPNRGIFLGAAMCMLIIVLMELSTAACTTLGSLGMIQPIALSAWMPVFVFLPFSAFSIRRLFD